MNTNPAVYGMASETGPFTQSGLGRGWCSVVSAINLSH